MLNIVVPMAGRGQRFVDAGYDLPKPLIPVHGVPMVKLVIANLMPDCPHRFHFLIQRAHDQSYGLAARLAGWAPGCTVAMVDGVTEGAACTVLLARTRIDNDDALMIANCDQYIDADINRYLDALGEADGLPVYVRGPIELPIFYQAGEGWTQLQGAGGSYLDLEVPCNGELAEIKLWWGFDEDEVIESPPSVAVDLPDTVQCPGELELLLLPVPLGNDGLG